MGKRIYVDFGSLLAVSPEESKYRISVTNDHDHPSLCLEHVKQKQATLSHGYLPGLDWRRNRNVKYATIDDAVRLIKSLGKGCFLAKTDIKSAFRIIHVAPSDFPLLGMEWQGKFYSDKCLPMGCSSSCNIFETFSTALEWIA